MRISDWSSDVCSSDLQTILADTQRDRRRQQRDAAGDKFGSLRRHILELVGGEVDADTELGERMFVDIVRVNMLAQRRCTSRSEEHTSELQSLMRSSYAVFCLKKTTQPRKAANNLNN